MILERSLSCLRLPEEPYSSQHIMKPIYVTMLSAAHILNTFMQMLSAEHSKYFYARAISAKKHQVKTSTMPICGMGSSKIL